MSFIIKPSSSTSPANAPVDILAAQSVYYEAAPASWTITNFDSYTTYTVTTTNGSVSQANGTITYTPATAGSGGFVINGRTIGLTINPTPLVEFLLVSGGSAGGRQGPGGAGGGGGGGYYYSSGVRFIPGTSYAVAIGAGAPIFNGSGGGYTPASPTTFSTYTAIIGNRAGQGGGDPGGSTNPCATTGGAGGWGVFAIQYNAYTFATFFNGGNAQAYEGGGGGGAGSAGKNWDAGTNPGKGGDGYATTIRGSTEYFGGGGGAGSQTATRLGGLGGGGNGGFSAAGDQAGIAGTVNTGGGGGGCIDHISGITNGMGGGSGILILAYPDTYSDLTIGGGLTYTRSIVLRPGYKVYTFPAGSDNINW